MVVKLSKSNIRIISPLILYCLFNKKINLLLRYLGKDKYKEIMSLSVDNYLDEKYSKYDFQKIYQSFIRRTNLYNYDNQTKSLIRENILSMMKTKKISKYRIYTDLNLNAGNINDFLTNNHQQKVSLKTVKKIYGYCLNY